MEILADIQRWYNAQCDGEWEHEFGLKIETLDSPGWLVKIDLADTLLENQPFEPVDIKEEHGKWLSCHVEKSVFRGLGDPSQLSQILNTFLAWAKMMPDWLALPDESKEANQIAEDKDFWSRLGEEIGPETCRSLGCTNKRVAYSVFCKQHHFEAINNRPYIVDQP
jgi:hypothetical protein